MKKVKLMMMTLMMCFVGMSYGQDTIRFDELSNITKRVKFDVYISSNGEIYSVGDTLEIGVPSGTNGLFLYLKKYIALSEFPVDNGEVGLKIIIKEISTYGMKKTGFRIQFKSSAYGGSYWYDIENSLNSGEIKSDIMSSDEALSELKKCKDKLDLGLITQEEFEKKKEELSKFIK